MGEEKQEDLMIRGIFMQVGDSVEKHKNNLEAILLEAANQRNTMSYIDTVYLKINFFMNSEYIHSESVIVAPTFDEQCHRWESMFVFKDVAMREIRLHSTVNAAAQLWMRYVSNSDFI